MTDQERREAIEEFVEYAEQRGLELCRRALGDPRPRFPVDERDVADMIDRHLLERIPR